eukprot:5069533-Alexandrium_andersonii.AAC.1
MHGFGDRPPTRELLAHRGAVAIKALTRIGAVNEFLNCAVSVQAGQDHRLVLSVLHASRACLQPDPIGGLTPGASAEHPEDALEGGVALLPLRWVHVAEGVDNVLHPPTLRRGHPCALGDDCGGGCDSLRLLSSDPIDEALTNYLGQLTPCCVDCLDDR